MRCAPPRAVAALVATLAAACDFPGAVERCRASGRCSPQLASLEVSTGTLSPPFAPGRTEYELLVPRGTIGITVTPTVAEPTQVTVEVAGTIVASGAASPVLPVGLSGGTIEIAVIGRAGGKTVYAVALRRPPPTYLKASNTGQGDRFGSALAVSADSSTLVVGAPGEASSARGVNGVQSDDGAPGSGAVYIFVRAGTSWSQQAYLKASNTGQGDRFGGALALSADGLTLAVGASGEGSSATGVNGAQDNDGAPSSGAVYVFVRTGTSWSQQAYLKASNTGQGDRFGASVALGKDLTHGLTLLAVGAPGEDSAAAGVDGDPTSNSAVEAGAVHIFTFNGAIWSQHAYLKASNTGAGDAFGSAVALSGSGLALAVGAPGEDSSAAGLGGDQSNNAAVDSGAAYLFSLSSSWSQQVYVKASNPRAGSAFGASIALSKDGVTLGVGANQESSTATGVNGDQTSTSAPGAGAVYLFFRTSSAWGQIAYVKPSNTVAGDRFGASIALSADGKTLAAAAPGESSAALGTGGDHSDDSAARSGVIYSFSSRGAAWAQDASLKSLNTSAGAQFGSSACLSSDGTTLAAGAPGENSTATGIDGDSSIGTASLSGAAYVNE